MISQCRLCTDEGGKVWEARETTGREKGSRAGRGEAGGREERGRKSDSGKTERRDTSGGGGVDSQSLTQSVTLVLHSDR